MTSRTVQLQQASQRFTMPGQLVGDQFDYNLCRGSDVVTFTEVRTFHTELAHACKRHHYKLLLPDGGDTAIAVLAAHEVIDHGYAASVEGVPGKASAGGHGERGIQHVTMRLMATREHVSVATGHWVTRRADTGRQQYQMTRDLADRVAQLASGRRLAFWSGDTNNDDHLQATSDVDRELRRGDLTSCWDELGRYPDTVPGATIDIIGSYDPDRRVECLRARTWHALHSDHKSVSAWYRIRGVRGW